MSGAKTGVGKQHPTGSTETRRQLVLAAVEALKERGFAGASAREIARRAGCNQALVFYHFGSVGNLLLAALDHVSTMRLDSYRTAISGANDLADFVDVARTVFEEDLDAGHMTVLAEMIAGASSMPGMGPEVISRIAPWRTFAAEAVERAISGNPIASLANSEEIAHGIVALYLGLEMLAHLEGDRSAALDLFDKGRVFAGLLAALGSSTRKENT